MTTILGTIEMSRTTPPLPPTVIEAIAKFAKDIKRARRRRHWSTVDLAYCLKISRTTLAKVERGNPAVSLGIYAAVLDRLKLLDRLTTAADSLYDRWGRSYVDARLKQRIHGLGGRRVRRRATPVDASATTAQADGDDHSP